MSDLKNPPTITPPVRIAEPVEIAANAPAADRSAPPAEADADRASPGSWATLWLTDRDVVVFTVLAAIVLVMLVVRWGQLSGWGRREIEIERMTPLPLSMHLDPNEATWVELSQLDGVGEALAVRIVEDRAARGPYRSLDDLDRVKGIGPKTIERLRPYLRIEQTSGEP